MLQLRYFVLAPRSFSVIVESVTSYSVAYIAARKRLQVKGPLKPSMVHRLTAAGRHLRYGGQIVLPATRHK